MPIEFKEEDNPNRVTVRVSGKPVFDRYKAH